MVNDIPTKSPPPQRGQKLGRGELPSATLLERTKHLRAHHTEAERKLWYYLRAKRFLGFKFKRQKPTGPYIADFVCLERRLVIEADGSQHDDANAYGRRRNDWFQAQGITVLRFWDHDILARTESVLERIRLSLTAAVAPSPHPLSPEGRGARKFQEHH